MKPTSSRNAKQKPQLMKKHWPPEDDTHDLNEAVMESAASPTYPTVLDVAAMDWDEQVGSAGFRAPRRPNNDPEDIDRHLAEAGSEEAGREQRLAAGDMDPPA